MKILVTGANGLLATNVIMLLLEQGYEVKGLLRSPQKFVGPAHDNLSLISGDITHKMDVEHAAEGCDHILHIAAITAQNLLRYKDYRDVNVVGTQYVLEAAIKHGIKRLVFVSSANTFGYGDFDYPGDETQPIMSPFSWSYYSQSKREAQEILITEARHDSHPELVIVNPSFMIGAYDSKPSSGRIIQQFYHKKLILHPPGGKNFIHVADAAQGVISAMEKGKHGEAYILGNENLTYREFFEKLSQVSGREYIFMRIPCWILKFVGSLGDIVRMLGFKTELSSVNMKVLCVKNFYSSEKARRELDLGDIPIEDAIEDALEWFDREDF